MLGQCGQRIVPCISDFACLRFHLLYPSVPGQTVVAPMMETQPAASCLFLRLHIEVPSAHLLDDLFLLILTSLRNLSLTVIDGYQYEVYSLTGSDLERADCYRIRLYVVYVHVEELQHWLVKKMGGGLQ